MEDTKPVVQITPGNSVVDVTQDGKPFLVYNFASDHAGLFKPFFHPVMGPNGWPITQNGEFPGTIRGHYWHHALFIGHQKLSHRTDTGAKTTSFWEERAEGSGRIIHEKFEPVANGDAPSLTQRLVWRSGEGREVLRETRIITVPKAPADKRIIDIELRFKAARDAIRLEQTPYNLLACRVINAMCRTEEKESYTKRYANLVDFRPLLRGGKLVNSEGKENNDVRGERAKWVDFSGPLDNASTGGIALFDHPMNERHPTPWHNWNNMTFMASFTYLDFYELAVDKELRLKYRVFIHAGDAKEADVEGAWNDFGHRA